MAGWQSQRTRELWAAAIGPASLVAGLWGMVFQLDWLIVAGMGGVLLAHLLGAANWKGRALGIAAFALSIFVGSLIAPSDELSDAGRFAAVLFGLGSVFHLLEHFGNSVRLMDKLVESGEFQRDVVNT